MASSSILNIKPLGFPWATQDPFIFCAYHRDYYPKGNAGMGPAESLAGRNLGQDFGGKDGWSMYHGQKVPGFPYHPHRGFETISIVKEGMVDHSDSIGAAGRFGDGDVQWMTAGKGVQHSEMFPLLHEDKDNPLEMFQIWLNLPRKSKFVDPHFAMLWKEKIPIATFQDEAGKHTTVDVIAGSLDGKTAPVVSPNSWAADPENDVAVWTIKIEAGGNWTLPAAKAGLKRSLYFYTGESLLVEGQQVPVKQIIEVNPDASIEMQAQGEDAYLLMLQGRPINEPVVQYGPFVMNSEEEIREAYRDYQRTQFGGWPWPESEYVHEKDRGRFALHADGREEVQ